MVRMRQWQGSSQADPPNPTLAAFTFPRCSSHSHKPPSLAVWPESGGGPHLAPPRPLPVLMQGSLVLVWQKFEVVPHWLRRNTFRVVAWTSSGAAPPKQRKLELGQLGPTQETPPCPPQDQLVLTV